MGAIKCKTRKNATSKGKARMYFSCHPEDFEIAFEELTNEILQRYDCAIYYYNPDDEIEMDNLIFEVSQMQMAIIPITTKYLSETNRAYEVEFKIFKEQHIPILPIMLETGLDEIFNQKCGNIQYLTKNENDVTAIKYEEKLMKFMDSVFLNDELIKKIQSAFDAYIFLSYRKKDRRYAQELMKLIHKNDFARDIAIWYDEFLTPGEDFNEVISQALKNSSLFTLLVTPNLINENNYVMETEYPMAKKENKEILPVESVATDRDELNKNFIDIGKCYTVDNELELSDALLKKLHSIAILKNDESPEHNFFIGLAYLMGIDVEIDREKAVKLLEKAAEGELEEAIAKLSSMYYKGDGVAINYEKAFKWQKKLIRIRQEKYLETQKFADGLAICEASEEEGDRYFEQTNLNEAYESYRYMDDMIHMLLDDFFTDESEQLEELRKYYKYSFSTMTAKILVDKMSKNRKEKKQLEDGLRKMQIRCMHRKAIISIEFGRIDEAEQTIETALEKTKQIENELFLNELMYKCYHLLGKIYNIKGKLTLESEVISKALTCAKKINAIDSSSENQETLASAYDALGNIYIELNKGEEAKEIYTKALEIRNNLNKTSNTLCGLAYSYYSLSFCDNDLNEKAAHLQKCIDLYMEAASNNNLKALLSVLHPMYMLCVINLTNDPEHNVEGYFSTTYDIVTQIMKYKAVQSSYQAIIDYNIYYSDIMCIMKDYKKAIEKAELALKLHEMMVENFGNTFQYRNRCAEIQAFIGDLYRYDNNIEKAKSFYEQSDVLLTEIMKNSLDANKRNLDWMYNRADMLLRYGDIECGDKQAMCYAKAYNAIKFLCEVSPENSKYQSLKKAILKSIKKYKENNKK